MWFVSLSNTALSRFRLRDLHLVVETTGADWGPVVAEVMLEGGAADLNGEEPPCILVVLEKLKDFEELHDGSKHLQQMEDD